jgi:hypothetical protein
LLPMLCGEAPRKSRASRWWTDEHPPRLRQ